jgi:hypothetical protein
MLQQNMMYTKKTNNMNYLPIEIVNLILEYQGYHSYRNGKYVKKLHIHNDVIELLMNMKKIKKNIYGTYEVCFWKKVSNPLVENSIFQFPKNNIYKDIIFIIETHTVGSQVLWVMNISKHYDSNDSYDDRDRTQFILHR